jgi:hypothetical protein
MIEYMKERIQYEPSIYCHNRIEVTYEIPNDYPDYMMYFPKDHGLYMCNECKGNFKSN